MSRLLRPLDLQHGIAPKASLLGAACYGMPLHGSLDICVSLPVLPEGGQAITSWLAPGPFIEGKTGALQYRYNEQVLFGSICVQEEDFSVHDGLSALQQASETAYAAVFETLLHCGFPHLVRCWNYLPRINVDGGGLERYRQFNIGRQDAFIAAARSHLGGAPSACALGSDSGGLMVYFLAARSEPQPIENPRQLSAYRYPEQYGPRSPTFSRASLLRLPGEEVLFISGTASIVGHDSVHPGNVRAQTLETLHNIDVLLEQANLLATRKAFSSKTLSIKVFIRNADDMPVVAQILREKLGNDLNVIYLQADICRIELLVEIEAFGFSDRAMA